MKVANVAAASITTSSSFDRPSLSLSLSLSLSSNDSIPFPSSDSTIFRQHKRMKLFSHHPTKRTEKKLNTGTIDGHLVVIPFN